MSEGIYESVGMPRQMYGNHHSLIKTFVTSIGFVMNQSGTGFCNHLDNIYFTI